MSLSEGERKQLFRSKQLAEDDKVDKAWDIVRELLVDHPFDRDCLYMAGHIYQKAGNLPVAYHLLRTATEQDPEEPAGWMNLGFTLADMWLVEEAQECYDRALKQGAKGDIRRITLGNLAALCVDNGRYLEAEAWAHQCLKEFPDYEAAISNLGFAQLGQGKFNLGWKNYRLCLGKKDRTKIQYKGEPEWYGEAGKRIVVYGEQGIGDEICFASMIPDAIRDCAKVIVDCDVRLAGLFSRSFPQARVYGTRQFKAHDCSMWSTEDREFDASIPSAQLGEYYRTSKEAFPRKPYLVPDLLRLEQWKHSFSKMNKPVIGIAWSGGIQRSGRKFRKCSLEEWAPLFTSVDAHYVSLQYKSASTEIEAFKSHGVDIVEYPWATITRDYDDTAALVAALDCVIGVPTAVVHLAGALGVPTFALSARMKCWKYAQGNLFQPVTNIEWAGSWEKTIKSAVPQVEKLCSGYSSERTLDSPSPTTSSNSVLRDAVASQLRSRRSCSTNFQSNGGGLQNLPTQGF